MIKTIKQLDAATDSEVSDLAQSVIERLAKAKWITGFARVSPSEVNLQLTELGKQKIGKLAKYLLPFECHLFVGEKSTATRWQKLKLMFFLRIHGNALFVPLLSAAEETALTGVLIQEARKLRVGE